MYQKASGKRESGSPATLFGERGTTNANGFFGLYNRQGQFDICGWENADQDSPIYCDVGYQCAQDQSNFGAGCCTTAAALQSCYLPTQCQPYAPSATSSSYTPNLYTTSCGSSNPYCFVRSYLYNTAQQTYYEVGCTTTKLPDQTVYDSYSGQPVSPSTTPNVATISVTAPNTNNGGSPAASLLATSDVAGQGNNGNGGAHTGGSDTGAIVGGVVGGLAGLALILGIVICCCCRRKKNNQDRKKTTTTTNQTHGSRSLKQYFSSSSVNAQPAPSILQASLRPEMHRAGTQMPNSTETSSHERFNHHRQERHDFVAPSFNAPNPYSDQQSTAISTPSYSNSCNTHQRFKGDLSAPQSNSTNVLTSESSGFDGHNSAGHGGTGLAIVPLKTRDNSNAANSGATGTPAGTGQVVKNEDPALMRQSRNYATSPETKSSCHEERYSLTSTSTKASRMRSMGNDRDVGRSYARHTETANLDVQGREKDGQIYHELST